MSYKKKVPHIKGNEAKLYNAQLIKEKTERKPNTTPYHHTLGKEPTRIYQSKRRHAMLFHANTDAVRCKLE